MGVERRDTIQIAHISAVEFLTPLTGEISLRDYIFPAVPTWATWTPYLVTELGKSGSNANLLAYRITFLEQFSNFSTRQSFAQFTKARQFCLQDIEDIITSRSYCSQICQAVSYGG